MDEDKHMYSICVCIQYLCMNVIIMLLTTLCLHTNYKMVLNLQISKWDYGGEGVWGSTRWTPGKASGGISRGRGGVRPESEV